MPDKTIKDFDLDDQVTGFFAVRKKTVREYSRGQFVSLELGDYSGRIGAIMWEPDQFALKDLTEGDVVRARGVVGEYNNKKQFTLSRLRLAKKGEYQTEDILPHSSQPIADRKQRILSLTEKIENSYIRSLVDSFWNDEKFFDDFLKAAAGKLWHHAYVGGLSEHSANVAELALRTAAGYEFLNEDLLIFGGLLHDVGKVDTYGGETVIDFTSEGRLIGHICLADHWVAERAARIDSFPPELLMRLRHMILAHQGELAYATPVVPQIPEAFVLFYCDEIDSKMGAIERIKDKQDGKGWSEFIRLINRHLYFAEE